MSSRSINILAHSILKEELYTGSNDPAVVGQEVYYEITILNNGEGSINEILLTDSLLAAKGIEFNCENYNYIVPEDSLKCTSSAPYIVEQASFTHSFAYLYFLRSLHNKLIRVLG